MRPWHWRCNAKEIDVCLALWRRARTTLAVHHEKQVEPSPLCLTLGDVSPCQWVPVKVHPLPPGTSLCSVCNGCARLGRNIFFILINCMGAIYFPLRRWRWLGVRATLVRADKPLLTRVPAGGTRFTRKTMSTRSDARREKHTHRHSHVHL